MPRWPSRSSTTAAALAPEPSKRRVGFTSSARSRPAARVCANSRRARYCPLDSHAKPLFQPFTFGGSNSVMPMFERKSPSVAPSVLASSARMAWNVYSHGFFTELVLAASL